MDAEYVKYLGSPEWKETRKERLRLAGFRCAVCGTDKHLQVHHLTYARIFHEDMEDLLPLCRTHHDDAEQLIAQGRISRRGKVRRLAKKTLALLSGEQAKPQQGPRQPRKKGCRNAIQDALMGDPQFTSLLSLDRNPFKKRLRRMADASANRNKFMSNGMTLFFRFHRIFKAKQSPTTQEGIGGLRE